MSPVPRRAALHAIALAFASGLACGPAPAGKMSFAEAGFTARPPEGVEDGAVEPEEPPPPPLDFPAPESIASELPEGPPIDATLLRFAAQARERRARAPAGRGFPDDAIRAWRALAGELDAYLGRALPQTPLLELVRARVTIEAEWDYDLRHHGPAPAELSALVSSRGARLASRIATARALGLGLFARTAPPRLRWPVEQAGISSVYGMRTHPLDGRRRMHFGVDLAADAGRVVAAAAKGFVVRAGWMGGYGLMVEVRHEGGLITRYGHLAALLCGPGDAVEPGGPLGVVGRTGRATGPHLHFEVWRGGEPSDPLAWLGVVPASGAGAGDATR
ncbi:M23 family metallopeptidase [Anaeromyxobacter sp. Fw109-5]|uniref:M23 family metallopeptidase n=1 Tax=Anaeromyxobacter sp. (strain Fw109-5) TaxID=404589 RepID=UPI0000ED7004|nr:M23 family metallopeptidase [Anaeromyxobacter sp. Fw109-5]ABS27920.1 peptidase M23B [Anaeromyxobacter sp. Fw109-5]